MLEVYLTSDKDHSGEEVTRTALPLPRQPLTHVSTLLPEISFEEFAYDNDLLAGKSARRSPKSRAKQPQRYVQLFGIYRVSLDIVQYSAVMLFFFGCGFLYMIARMQVLDDEVNNHDDDRNKNSNNDSNNNDKENDQQSHQVEQKLMRDESS
jgi:hypothetical protein